MVDSDRSARFEITLNDHRDLGIQNCTSCKSATDCLIYFLRISPCFGCKNKCFRNNCDRIVYNNLICQFGYASTSGFTDQKCRGTKDIKIFLHCFEILCISPCHDCQCSVHCSRLSARYRCIQETNSFCLKSIVAFFGFNWGYRTHVAYDRAFFDGRCNSALSKQNGF